MTRISNHPPEPYPGQKLLARIRTFLWDLVAVLIPLALVIGITAGLISGEATETVRSLSGLLQALPGP